MSEKKGKRRRRGQDNLKKLLGEEKPKGLNPLDLLSTMPPDERKLINWLNRHRQATGAEIAEGLEWTEEKATDLLTQLKTKGQIRANRKKGMTQYRVMFGGRTGQVDGELPADIWNRIDATHLRFLSQMPIFSGLTKEELAQIADKMNFERLNQGDVIIWQGEIAQKVYFLKSGIAGVSILVNAQQNATQVMNYLQQGDVFGEYSMLADREVPATATVSAMTQVQLLSLPHDEFKKIMQTHSHVAIGLAQMLTSRLINDIPKQEAIESNLILVIGQATGQVIAGCSISAVLGRDQTTVYTEYPAPHNMINTFDLDYKREQNIYPQDLGFDLGLLNVIPSLPLTVRTTILLKQFVDSYHNVVIGLPWRIDEAIIYLLERASQIIMVLPADKNQWAPLEETAKQIQQYAHPEKSAFFTVQLTNGMSETKESAAIKSAFRPDYTIDEAAFVQMKSYKEIADFPEDMGVASAALADRLGRTNQISVFIPTTIDVDQVVDTEVYVQKTLDLLGTYFGGATSSPAQGVWNSEEAGIVAEEVYIVRSYATKSALNQHLSDVLAYVEQVKEELAQEAMAVEVNRKLILI